MTKLQRNYSCDIKMSVSLSNILTYFLVIFIYQEHEFISDFLKENALKIYTSLRHDVPCEISALFPLSINFCLNLFYFSNDHDKIRKFWSFGPNLPKTVFSVQNRTKEFDIFKSI